RPAALLEVGDGAELDAVPRPAGPRGDVAERAVRYAPGAGVVAVVELEEQDLVAGHAREVPPLVTGIVVELEAAGSRGVRGHLRVQVAGDLVHEVQAVVQPFAGADAPVVAQGQRPVLRRRAEHAPQAGDQRPAEAGAAGEAGGVGVRGPAAGAGDREVVMHQGGLRLGGVVGGRRRAAQHPAQRRNPVGPRAGPHELRHLADVYPVYLVAI